MTEVICANLYTYELWMLYPARHAGSFDCLKTSLILITMDNYREHCAWWQSFKIPNQTHRGIKKGKMYAIKQIKICAGVQLAHANILWDLCHRTGEIYR